MGSWKKLGPIACILHTTGFILNYADPLTSVEPLFDVFILDPRDQVGIRAGRVEWGPLCHAAGAGLPSPPARRRWNQHSGHHRYNAVNTAEQTFLPLFLKKVQKILI